MSYIPNHSFATEEFRSNVNCEEGVIVEFVLFSVFNLENMEVNIFIPNYESEFKNELLFVGCIVIRNEKIIFECFPQSEKKMRYYKIGIECMERVRNNPISILG